MSQHYLIHHGIGNVGVGGAGGPMRFGANLMLRAIGKPNLRFFASIDAAKLWLNAVPVNNGQAQ
jgi:hypothetical protein